MSVGAFYYCCEKVQTTLISGTPGHVVLCATENQRALASKPESHDPPLPLVQIQSQVSALTFFNDGVQ